MKSVFFVWHTCIQIETSTSHSDSPAEVPFATHDFNMTIFIAKAVLLALTTSTLVAAGLIHQEAPVGVHDSHQASPNSSAASHSLERRNGMLYCGNFASKSKSGIPTGSAQSPEAESGGSGAKKHLST